MEASVGQFSPDLELAREGDSALYATARTRPLGSLLFSFTEAVRIHRAFVLEVRRVPVLSRTVAPPPRRRPVDDTLIGASAPSSSEVCPLSLEEQCPLSQKSGRKYAFRYDRLSDRLVLYLCPFLQWPCACTCAARHASPEMATVSSRTTTFHCNAPHCIRRQSQRREALAALPMGYVTICPDYSFRSPRWLMGQYVLFPGGWVLSWPDPSTSSDACTTEKHAPSLAPIRHSSPSYDGSGVTLATRPFTVTAPPRAEVNTPAS